MKIKLPIVLVALCLCFVTVSYAQKGSYKIRNGIALQGGVTQFDIQTDNFVTKKGNGFIGGMVATVDLPTPPLTLAICIKPPFSLSSNIKGLVM